MSLSFSLSAALLAGVAVCLFARCVCSFVVSCSLLLVIDCLFLIQCTIPCAYAWEHDVNHANFCLTQDLGLACGMKHFATAALEPKPTAGPSKAAEPPVSD